MSVLGWISAVKDSFPLNDRFVQEDYLEAAAKYGMEIVGINMYILECQGFIKFANHTAQGAHCLQAIKEYRCGRISDGNSDGNHSCERSIRSLSTCLCAG